MLKFKKEISLGLEISSYRAEKDEHIFTIKFDKKLYYDEDKLIDSVEYRISNVLFDRWFSDYPFIPSTDEEINLWEYNYTIFSSLFEDEEKYDKIIQEMCIKYCKEHNLPNSFFDVYNYYSTYQCLIFLASEILDIVHDDYVKNDKKYIGFYSKNVPYNETKFTLEGNKLKLENELVNMEFDTIDNTNKDALYKSLNEACYEFSTKWNKESLGKFDWDRYQKFLDSQK